MGVRKRHDSYKHSLTPNSKSELKKKSDKHNVSAGAHPSPAKSFNAKYATSSKKKQFNSGQTSFKALSKSSKEVSSGDDESSSEEYFEPQVPKSSTSKPLDRNNRHEEAIDIGDASMWPSADLDELISQIELLLPKEDNISYKSRADNLDWEKVAFRTYSAQQCRLMWDNISKKLRGFRILREVLQDAKEWTSQPWKDFYKRKANNRHPDMPRRPLSSYMLYFRHMHDKMKKKNSKLELTTLTQHISSLYKKLPEEKKKKYVEMAAIEKEKYIKEKELFYMKHPELRDTKSKGGKLQKPGFNDNDISKKSMPQKPLAPFRLFCDERLKKAKDEPGFDKTSFNARCRDLWSKMGDEKKGVWINWSMELEEKYNQEMQKYKAEHPEYVAPTTAPKSRLTKDDVATRDRLLGKPDKVPNSAYSLFSTMMLSSEELKTAAPKDRMLLISQQWRNLSAEEKKTYEDRVAHLKDSYKLEYAAYLHSLPPEKRELELQGEKRKMVKKKKHEDNEASPNEVNTSSRKKKKKIKENIVDNLFDGEPEAPPVHPSLLFAKSYRGDPATVQAAWKALTVKTQMKYRRKLEQVKQQYMTDYEEFLKGLDEDQLQEYSNLMKERNGEGRESESSSIETEESEPENEKDDSSEESRHSEEKNETSEDEEEDESDEDD